MVPKTGRIFFGAGLLAVLGYWFLLHPPGFGPLGYLEDLCTDTVRQLMAHEIRDKGGPSFVTHQYMAPYGAPVPFMSWSIERDWLGAYFWLWNRDFPFLWFYFGASLVASFAVVGAVLRRMTIGPVAAWLLAAAFVIFHVPRHYKTYYHFEHLPEHWIYASFFVDALIWHRFWRERRWSWSLELWRGVCLLGMLWGTGYFWGPLILEWAIVRAALVLGIAWAAWRGPRVVVDGSARSGAWAFGVMFLMAVIDVRWYVPLLREVAAAGKVWQPVYWYAEIRRVFEPLWASWFYPGTFGRVDASETVVTIGWAYWIPVLLALRAGLGIAPFALVLALLVLYIYPWQTFAYQAGLQAAVPFMEFFRVASRTGLFFPVAAAAIIASAWPEIVRTFRWLPRVTWAVFAVLVLAELPHLTRPISVMNPMPTPLKEMLVNLRDAPGTTVLDLPFCVAGGNGVCTTQQCPNYPRSTVGACFRQVHDKQVYGLYQARMTEKHCRIYDRLPYMGWFDAWRKQRCLTSGEWDDFCTYLAGRPELSAVLVYPDIWTAVAKPECRAELEKRLGAPVGQAMYEEIPVQGQGTRRSDSRVLRYAPTCGKAGKPG